MVELTDNVEILRNAVIDYRDRVVPDLWAERNHYRAALEATRDALADPNALDEAIDSPANKAFAIINHALAASPRKQGSTTGGDRRDG